MRTVVPTEDGILEVNYMWLPTFIGMNNQLKKEMEEAIKDKIEGKVLSEELLNEADNLVIEYLEKKFVTIEGLRDYLNGLKFITTYERK